MKDKRERKKEIFQYLGNDIQGVPVAGGELREVMLLVASAPLDLVDTPRITSTNINE